MLTKYISLVFTFVFGSSFLFAQVDRTKAPEAGPAPKIQIGEYKSFELKNGLKVFVVENHKIPRTTFSLIFDNDPILEKEKAGYVTMAGQLLRSGTTNYTKAELDEEVDFIGASLRASSNSVYASSLSKHKDKLLQLMTDVLFHPAFPEDELEKIRKQTLSAIAAGKESPNEIASNVEAVLNYGKDHPYGELTTEETVKNVTVEDIKNYYNTYFKPNVAYMAVVGDISFKDAKKLVKKYFSDWEKGNVPKATYAQPQAPEQATIAMVDRPSSVQSVISVTYPVELKPGQPDVVKANVMNQILGGGFSSRLMQNLREDKSFTYGARSSISSDELIGNFSASASVRNAVTDSAVFEFIKELKKIRNEKVEQSELDAAKASILGSFARSLEQPSTVASFAINTARYNLPEDYYQNYLRNVSSTTLEEVKAMADKYIKPGHANILVVGKASEVAEKLKAFGPVKYYDIYGNEYEPKDKAELPAGLTAEKVIDNYIKAIGGKEALSKVKSVKIVMGADMGGRSITITSIKKEPKKMLLEVSMAGNVMSKQVLNEEEVAVTQMGNKVPIDETAKEQLMIEGYIFPELKYKELDIKTKLIGIEKVEDTDAYAVELTYPSGNKVTEYYDIKSGFKIRVSRNMETPQGEVNMATDMGDYKEVSGVYFAHSVTQPIGAMKLSIQASEVKVNPEVSDDLFKPGAED
ncbi:M16 family metallopeptidase [Fulvivirga sediminis]|uniref:Insulinase family protein n=1 Tax=Fulvivirga sediminis TaxID=2803949 RepID=A0A937FBA9_9BACT|nr:pitrilysin family protein [Fulvivirga sediminis]MBL3659075.1 insulinase family protein [Fulvivirga sediminis]